MGMSSSHRAVNMLVRERRETTRDIYRRLRRNPVPETKPSPYRAHAIPCIQEEPISSTFQQNLTRSKEVDITSAVRSRNHLIPLRKEEYK